MRAATRPRHPKPVSCAIFSTKPPQRQLRTTHSKAVAAALCLLGLLSGRAAAVPAAPVWRDDLNRPVALVQPPRRIVSLVPSLTEIVCALGECPRLVATDRDSNWPPEVKALPKAGGLDDVQLELIAALQPDLVLLGGTARGLARFEQLGLPTFAIEVQRYADVARSITLVAQLLDVPARGVALNARIEQGVAAVAAQALQRPGAAPAVYFEVSSEPYAAGATSFIGELLARLHTRNIVGAELGPFPRLNPEYVVRQNPAVIFVAGRDAPALAARPGWAGIRAVREQRLCSFPREQGDAIVRPGPRVVEGMQALAACLARVAPP